MLRLEPILLTDWCWTEHSLLQVQADVQDAPFESVDQDHLTSRPSLRSVLKTRFHVVLDDLQVALLLRALYYD